LLFRDERKRKKKIDLKEKKKVRRAHLISNRDKYREGRRRKYKDTERQDNAEMKCQTHVHASDTASDEGEGTSRKKRKYVEEYAGDVNVDAISTASEKRQQRVMGGAEKHSQNIAIRTKSKKRETKNVKAMLKILKGGPMVSSGTN